MNEKKILNVLNNQFLSNPKWVMNNLHVYDWESDYLAITKSLYAYEIEVKTTVADYKADFKKPKHKMLRAGKLCPNYFFFASEPNIINIQDVPDYAGLIWVYKGYYATKKVAPKLHSLKFDVDGHKMVDKFYYNYISWKYRATMLKDNDPKPKIREAAKKAANEVRESAVSAFGKVCEYADFSLGEYPVCKLAGSGFMDCILQCEKGRLFKNMLK